MKKKISRLSVGSYILAVSGICRLALIPVALVTVVLSPSMFFAIRPG